MALAEITTEMDFQKPAKTKDKQGPKKPLASMKKLGKAAKKTIDEKISAKDLAPMIMAEPMGVPEMAKEIERPKLELVMSQNKFTPAEHERGFNLTETAKEFANKSVINEMMKKKEISKELENSLKMAPSKMMNEPVKMSKLEMLKSIKNNKRLKKKD
jgi:hypothetical protein